MLFKDITLLDKDYNVLPHMYVLTEGEYITYVGKTPPDHNIYNEKESLDASSQVKPEISPLEKKVHKNIKAQDIYDGRNKLLMPGLYNSLTHSGSVIMHGVVHGVRLDKFLKLYLRPVEDSLSAQDIKCVLNYSLMRYIASGCCSISEIYFYIDEFLDYFYQSGLKTNISEQIYEIGDTPIKELESYKRQSLLFKEIKSNDYGEKIKGFCSLHPADLTSESFIKQFSSMLQEENKNLYLYVSETNKSNFDFIEKFNTSPLKYFYNCGLFDHDKKSVVCGGSFLSREDIDIMIENNIAICRCYSDNLKNGAGIPVLIPELERKNACLIGTTGSCNSSANIFKELHLAALVENGLKQNASAISPQQVLNMVTVNAAKYQERENCGYIAPGMKADMIVLDLDQPHMQPLTDIVANIVYSAQSSDIVLNMVDGDVIYKDGDFTYIDKERAFYDYEMCKYNALQDYYCFSKRG